MDDCKCFRGEGVEGRDQNAISKMFISFCEAVIEIIGLPLIKLLRHFLKMQKQISEFVIPFIILKVFRSIDRTHILSRDLWQTHKTISIISSYFSINVKVICDNQGNFMDVAYKWPGPIHDEKVVSLSYVCKSFQNVNLAQRYLNLSHGFEAISSY